MERTKRMKSAVLRAQTRHAAVLIGAKRRVIQGGRWPAALALVAMAAACGGGDDAGPAKQVATLPAEKPIEQPIVTMPSSTYTGKHLEAFTRINEARIAAGVSALKQSVELDRAAQAHADYLVRNNVRGHFQSASDPLFTGVDAADRARAQKYKNTIATEIISYADITASGSAHINLHLNSVYHLQGALMPAANEIGLGTGVLNSGPATTHLSVTTGVTDVRLQALKNFIHWPTDNSSGIPRRFIPASESPNPIPDVAPNYSVVVGPPIMYCRASNETLPLSLSNAKIVDTVLQTSQRAWLLKHASVSAVGNADIEIKNDPNASVSTRNCLFLIPKEPLEAQRRYEVLITFSEGSTPTSKNWSFVTGD